MRRDTGALRALAVVLFGLVPAGALFVFFYSRYLDSRQQQLTVRNFRALDTASRQIQGRFEGIRAALRNAARAVENGKASPPAPNVVFEAVTDSDRGRTASEFEVAEGHTRVDLASDQERPQLRLLHPTANERFIHARASLRDLMDPLHDLGLFDEVVIAYWAGKRIIYQAHAPAGSGIDLQALLDSAENPSQPDAPADAKPEKPAKERTRTTVTRPLLVWHRGTRYLLFLEPVAIPLVCTGRRAADGTPCVSDGTHTPWMIGGLVQEQRFKSEARMLSPNVLVLLIFLLAMAVLAWPLLKLVYMGPRERLHGSDVRVLFVSSIVALGLLTFIALAGFAYVASSSTLDGDMEALATDLEARFRKELLAASTALNRLSSSINPAEVAHARHGPRGVDGVTRRLSEEPWTESASIQDLVWVSAEGRPRAQWKLRPDDHRWKIVDWPPAADLDLRDRRYFIDAQANRLLNLDGARFALESVQARTTGANAIVLAIPLGGMPGKSEVALVSTQLPSVIGPVLSPGFGFAVIDDRGQVLLHSNARRNLHENLFEECDNDGPLRQAVFARRATYVDSAYYGDAYRLYVRPLRDMPWSLVMLREKAPLRRASLALAVCWSVLFSAYFGTYLVLLLAVQTIKRRYRAEWAWPDRSRSPSQVTGIFIVISVSAGVIAAVSGSDALATLTGLLLLPPLAVLLLYLRLGPGPALQPYRILALVGVALLGTLVVMLALAVRGPTGAGPFLASLGIGLLLALAPQPRSIRMPREGPFRLVYSSLLLSVLIVAAVVPSIVFFVDAWKQTRVVLVRLAQLEFSRALVDREHRIQTRAVVHGLPPWVSDARLHDEEDVYSASYTTPMGDDGPPSVQPSSLAPWEFLFCGTAASDACREHVPLIQRWLSAAVLDGLSAPRKSMGALGPLIHDGASDGAWRWEGGTRMHFTQAAFQRPIAYLGGATGLGAALPSLRLANAMLPQVAGGLAFVGVVTVLLLVVRSVSRRIFLLDLGPLDIREIPPEGSVDLAVTWVFTRPGDVPFSELLMEPVADVIDLLQIQAPRHAARCATQAKAALVIVDHLEARLTAPEWSGAVVGMISSLSGVKDRTVVLVSRMDPLPCLWSHVSGEAVAREQKGTVATDPPYPTLDAELFGRWATLLSSFSKQRILVPTGATVQSGGRLAQVLGASASRQDLSRPANGTGAGTFSLFSPDARLRRGDDPAEARFWTVWSQCTKAERLALRQLAEEGFANPNNLDVLRRLGRRLLIVRAPALKLHDPGFRHFVLRAESKPTIAAWEREGAASDWSRLRFPLVAGSILIAVFFFVTQPEALSATIGLVGLLAGTIPALVQLLGAARTQRNVVPAQD